MQKWFLCQYINTKRSNSVPSASLLVLSLVPATPGLTPLRDFHFYLPRAARLCQKDLPQTCYVLRTRSGHSAVTL